MMVVGVDGDGGGGGVWNAGEGQVPVDESK